MNRRQSLRQLSFLASPFAVSSCAELGNLGRLALQNSYLVGQQSLLSRLLPNFPFSRQYGGIGQLSLSQPVLAMVPEQNKIRLGLTTSAGLSQGLGQGTGIDFLKNLGGRATSGRCQLACGIRFEPKDNGIYLKDPVLEEFQLDGLASSYSDSARSLVNLVGPQILDRYPVHTLQSGFATRALQAMTVRKEGLLLDFGA